jgi:hypothetical protein
MANARSRTVRLMARDRILAQTKLACHHAN